MIALINFVILLDKKLTSSLLLDMALLLTMIRLKFTQKCAIIFFQKKLLQIMIQPWADNILLTNVSKV